VIPEQLRAAGAEVDVIEALRNRVPEKSRARLRALMRNAKRRPHIVTFTSSSTVKNFGGTARPAEGRFTRRGLAQRPPLCFNRPVTSATLRELQMPVAIEAREFTMVG